jgi:hypothetical protein
VDAEAIANKAEQRAEVAEANAVERTEAAWRRVAESEVCLSVSLLARENVREPERGRGSARACGREWTRKDQSVHEVGI